MKSDIVTLVEIKESKCILIDGKTIGQVSGVDGSVAIEKPFWYAILPKYNRGFYIDETDKPSLLFLRVETEAGEKHNIRLGTIDDLANTKELIAKLNKFYQQTSS